MVGYQLDGEVCWDEFLLSRIISFWLLPEATSDPDQWARAAEPEEIDPHLGQVGAAYRRRIHWREGATQWLVASIIVKAVLLFALGAVGLLSGSLAVWLLFAAIGSLAVSGLIAVVELAALH